MIGELEEPLVTWNVAESTCGTWRRSTSPNAASCPATVSFWAGNSIGLRTKAALDTFLAEQETKFGHELRVVDDNLPGRRPSLLSSRTGILKNGHDSALEVVDLHEMQIINHACRSWQVTGSKSRTATSQPWVEDGSPFSPSPL
jgi:hypothetical protein